MEKEGKGDLHVVEYATKGRRHRIWLFRRQEPAPDPSLVHSELTTTNEDHAIVVRFVDSGGNHHCHRYPMCHVARSEAGSDPEWGQE